MLGLWPLTVQVFVYHSLHRSLPYGLRNVVGELELRGASLVTAEQVAAYAGVVAGSPAAYDIIRRLVAARWLRPLPVKGRYEFLPVVPGRIFGAELVDDVPVSTRERLLLDVALWPDTVGVALRDRDHWLGRALAEADTSSVVEMLRRLDSPTAAARAGYLDGAFGRDDLAGAVAELGRSRVSIPLLPATAPTPSDRRDRRFNVVDPVGAATVA